MPRGSEAAVTLRLPNGNTHHAVVTTSGSRGGCQLVDAADVLAALGLTSASGRVCVTAEAVGSGCTGTRVVVIKNNEPQPCVTRDGVYTVTCVHVDGSVTWAADTDGQSGKRRRAGEPAAAGTPPTTPDAGGVSAGAAAAGAGASDAVPGAGAGAGAGPGAEAPPIGHPYGVHPMGALLLAPRGLNRRAPGLGALATLPDDLLLACTGFLGMQALGRLACVSRAAYVVAHHNDTWRELVLAVFASGFTFVGGCWKQTCQGAALRRHAAASLPDDMDAADLAKRLQPHSPLQFPYFSDTLFQPYMYTTMHLKKAWLAVDNVDRRPGLSVQDFITEYEAPRRPVIIPGAAADLTLKDFIAYCDGCHDDSPLYLFDCRVGDKCDGLVDDVGVPQYFQEDLFQLLGDARPDFRWMIYGAARSGSKWHIDPNSTMAWNTTIRGRKKWMFLPPGCPPPGVHPSPDGAVVAQPVSLIEWFRNFYAASQRTAGKPFECVTNPGDTVFVPQGWWHCVLNLEDDTMAMTQNYVCRRNLLDVLRFLRESQHLVSGVDPPRGSEDPSGIAQRLEEAFEAKYPGELATLRTAEAAEAQRLAEEKQQRAARQWAAATSGDRNFSFGF